MARSGITQLELLLLLVALHVLLPSSLSRSLDDPLHVSTAYPPHQLNSPQRNHSHMHPNARDIFLLVMQCI